MSEFYNQYYKELQEALDSNNISIHYNKDRSHNAVIMSFMLDNSTELYMFCGEMSVLREGFYGTINQEYQESDPDRGSIIKGKVEKSLLSFLNREGSKLNIILEKQPKSDSNKILLFDDVLCEHDMKHAIENGRVAISVLPETFLPKSALNHFTVNDRNIFRVEDDKQEHTAICCINSEENAATLRSNFLALNSHADPSYPQN